MGPPPKAREHKFITSIGVAGRKTGLTIEDTGQRDAFGMEPMGGFFSPEVSSRIGVQSLNEGPSSTPAKTVLSQTNSIEESMDIVTSDQSVARITNRSSLPPPRARSPIKTNLNSPARRASSVGLSSPAPQRPFAGDIKINRRLDFSSQEQSSSASGPAHLASSPAPLAIMSPAPGSGASTRIARANGGSMSSSAEKENAQTPAVRGGKVKAKPPLEQVIEEDPPTPVAEPTPAKKKQKRGLLVSKKAAVGEKKAFSMEVMSSDDESMDETEVEEEEQKEGHATMKRDVFDELPQIIDNSVVVMDDDTVMAETEVEDEDSESLPDVIPPKSSESKAKSAKSKPEPANSKAVSAKKPKTAPLDKGKGKEGAQPTRSKASGTGKPTKGKVAEEQEPKPLPATKAKPAPRVRGKKALLVAPPNETEGETEEEEPVRPPKSTPLKSKAVMKGKGKGKAVVRAESEPEPTPPPPLRTKTAGKGKGKGKAVAEEPELAPPLPKAKAAGKGRSRGKPIQEPEEIPESESESESAVIEEEEEKEEEEEEEEGKEEEEEEEEQEDQPPKKRSRTAKERAPPKRKLSAKAKGKAPAAPPKEKPIKATKKTAQKAKEPSPELESFTPSSPPVPIRAKARVNKATKAEASSSSMPPPASQPAGKKSGQRIIKAPPPPPRAPTEDIDGIRRSSRPRVEPLAYWRNEKIVYGLGALAKNNNMRLPEVLEIVRVESDSEEKERAERRKRSYSAAYRAGVKRKRSAKEKIEEDELEEEDWESRMVEGEVGVVRGYVKSYPPGHAAGEEEVELAFSRNRIVTVEVANGDFTFVKTCTEEFFGTGMIEVPPGGIKRTKNSGKMHLVFYIISGKVEVKIGENSFRVRKGAQFMVPRGNLYSIQNPYDVQARMFFAQGCEVIAPEEDYEEGESE